MSNTRITVFSITRSENIHILCNFCILSSVEPKKVKYFKNLKIVYAFSYVKQKVLLFAFIILCYIESCIIKYIKYAKNCFYLETCMLNNLKNRIYTFVCLVRSYIVRFHLFKLYCILYYRRCQIPE